MTTTIEALSPAQRALLEQRLRGESAAGPAPLRPSGLARFPLSPEQRHIWLHAALAPELPLYNEGFSVRRRGPLDVAALERALGWFVARHEIWRTRFDFSGAEPEQCVEAPFAVRLPPVDLSALPAAAREAEALRLGGEQIFPPFDLARVPLFRALLVRLADDDHRLFVALHHFIFDGVSIGQTMLAELAAAYAAFAAGGEPAPGVRRGGPALQYGDYALWRMSQGTNASHTPLIARWQDMLADAPERTVLPSRPAPAERAGGAAMRRFALPAALVGELRALGHSEGATLYQTLLAAFAVLLRRDSGDDLLIGSLVDLRRRPEFAPVMGYMLNTVPIRLRPAGALPFRQHLGAVRAAALAALEASELPFEQILRVLAGRRPPGARPIVNVMIAMQPQPKPIDGWRLVQMDMPSGGAKFDLALEVEEHGAELLARFIYAADRFEAATIDRLIGDYMTVLAGIVADSDRALDRYLGPEKVTAGSAGPPHPASPPVNGGRGKAAASGSKDPPLRRAGEGLRGGGSRGSEPRRSDAGGAVDSRLRGNDKEQSEREHRLAAIWREVLGVEVVGPEDDFFALGGHSLLVPALLSRVAARFGRAVPIAAAFRAPTIREFAALLDQAPAPQPIDPAERALMLGFESLGDDCEFGFVQRRHGAEPLSLLRFTGIAPERLAEALEARFAGFDDPALLALRVDAARDECWIDNRRYGSSYLVFGAARAADGEKFLAWEARKIGVLRKQLLTTLAAGRRICVLKCNEGVAEEVVRRIAAALAACGPTPLLWVAQAGPAHAPGEVERAGPGLFRGWIDRLAPRAAAEDASPLWLDICRRARRLHGADADADADAGPPA